MTEAAAPVDSAPLAERARVLAPGLYAWLLTVAHPAAQHGAPFAARLSAFAALVALAAAPFFVRDRIGLARALGIYGFIGLSALSWALLADELAVERIDRVRACVGALGWLLYAFGWGSVRPRGVPEDDPHAVPGARLVPRAHLPRASVPVAAFALAAALGIEALAFRVDRREPAVLAHAAAIALALLVIGTGARIALAQGTRIEIASGATRLNSVAVPGALLAVLLGLGLIWAALR
ncbi:MAG TPA: hypothetical protein VGK73_26345 [Polyangiaceae bacterium]